MASDILINDSVHSDFADFLIELSKHRTLVFDLDNTIYDEKEFLFQSYKNISEYLNKEYSCDKEDVYNFLSEQFLSGGRGYILDKLKSYLKINNENFINNCLEIIRSTVVSPPIQPYKYFSQFIKRTSNFPIFIITNGTQKQQANKMKSINFEGNSDIKVVYANDYLRKPAADSFLYLQKNYELNCPTYVGDSYEDFVFAKNCGIQFIEVFKKAIL